MKKECRDSPDGKHHYEPDVVIVQRPGKKEERMFFMVCRWCGKIKGKVK